MEVGFVRGDEQLVIRIVKLIDARETLLLVEVACAEAVDYVRVFRRTNILRVVVGTLSEHAVGYVEVARRAVSFVVEVYELVAAARVVVDRTVCVVD